MKRMKLPAATVARSSALMASFLILPAFFIPAGTSLRAQPASDSAGLVQYVNILQGTDSHPGLSHGNTLPLVGAPWGMTDWSLENSKDPWYFQPNGTVDGFRATHQPSPWIADYGQFVLMPQSGDLTMDVKARTSDYDASAAICQPDYEKVAIKKGGITAELTATERAAVFRFTYSQGQTGRVILNAAGDSEIQIDGRTIRGVSRFNNGGVTTNFGSYFVIELDRDVTKGEILATNKSLGSTGGKGDSLAAYVEFATTADAPVEVRVGTSLISWEQAEQNLKAETDGGFEAVHSKMTKLWNDNLGRIAIEAKDDQKKTFYSCLYHAQMFPHRLYEVDATGKNIHYSPYDGKLHDGVLYGDIGIWDAFRTTFPLITILYPAQLNDILQGFVNASAEGGTIPEWASPGYRDCMIGQHSAAIFADAVVKDQKGFDIPAAFASLKKSAFEPPAPGVLVRRGLADYMKLGYIPDGASEYAVSATLDYSYDDWCVAQIAKQQGDLKTYHKLMKRSQSFRHVWDRKVEFMHPKDAKGNWILPFDQFAWGGSYAEGGPWQDSFFVPHDTGGLVSLIGGRKAFVAKLDEMLGLPPIFHKGGYGGIIHEMREMGIANFGQYDQGNQPGFDSLYLFTAVGQPWQTEFWTRRVCTDLFNASAAGFPGDEDNGSMASWYVLSSIGLYSLCPGTPQYVFTSPLFSKVTVQLPEDKTLVITAADNKDRNFYVQKRQFNGADVNRTWISYQDLLKGGELHTQMGESANLRTYTDEELPYSESK